MKPKPILLLGLLTYSYISISQTSPSMTTQFSTIGVFMDQDLFVNPLDLGEDRNYTMGFGILYSSGKLRKSWLTSPVRWLSGKLFSNLEQSWETSDRGPFLYSLQLANGSFTPDDLTDYDVIINDRPYGNVTYFSQHVTRVNHTRNAKHSASLSFGILGTNISPSVQTEIHKWSNENDTRPPRTPRGWPNQVSQGGELTMMLTRSSEYLVTSKALSSSGSRFLGEMKHGWKYYLGYYTGAEYGINFRLGLIDPKNWTYDANSLDNSNKGIFAEEYYKAVEPEFYLVAGGRPVFMLYNALLNGQFRKSAHTLSFSDMKHVFFQWDLGVGGKIPVTKNFVIDLRWKILSGRTAEFKLPGREPRTHYWGGIDLAFTSY